MKAALHLQRHLQAVTLQAVESAHIVTCTEGTGTRFIQSVTRAFRTDPGGTNANNDSSTSDSSNASNVRTFDYITPASFELASVPC